jgi:pimeloyl-ACP methyl ester carboxylesterase
MTTACASAVRRDDLQDAMSLLDERFPERRIAVDGGVVSYRTCGTGPAIVLLHGIGSGAASWLPCALRMAQEAQVIAWNAPGYGSSSPLANALPSAADYAARLHQLLTTLGIKRCVLVGHSLGAIMASAYTAAHGDSVSKLVLLSPAQGYGSAARRAQGQQVAQDRLAALENMGVSGMAEHRSGRMLSPQASDAARAWVRWNMQQLDPAGYTQAVHMLCGDAIETYAPVGIAGAVYCGSADAITTSQDSRALAMQFALPFALIDEAGHACYVEQPDAVAAAIRQD